jgi:hypothetical protein
MLNPILKAVKEVYTTPGKTFVFGPEGEMGGTVFYAPASYQKVVDRIRSEYKGPAKLQIALMFNHAYLPGVINRADDQYGALPESKMWKKDGGWGPLLPFEQWPEHARLKAALPDIHKLLDSVDVLGVSCYARTSAYPKPEELESCADKYSAELKAMAFDLATWNAKPGKRFIFNEFALGGGISECGDTPAKTRAEAGRFSWLGGTSTYNWCGRGRGGVGVGVFLFVCAFGLCLNCPFSVTLAFNPTPHTTPNQSTKTHQKTNQ